MLVLLVGTTNNNRARIIFSSGDLSTHILNTGGTGTGKTNVIVEMTRQIKHQLTPDDAMIVFDTKRDFVKLHSENDIVITNVLEERLKSGIAWNIFMELVADGWDKESIEINADEVANLIFAESIENSQSPFS